MEPIYFEIPGIEVIQPIGSFYISRMNYDDLLKISFADIRRISTETDEVFGIQRELSPRRVKELKQYVTNSDATFPTSVILSINSSRIKSTGDPSEMELETDSMIEFKDNKLKILKDENVAKIIDGFHRVEGLRSYNGNPENFQLNVTIFIDMDPEDEAIVFATINKAQTKPSNSLVYDLFELSKSRSPQKTAHNIARLFNKVVDNPFYRKIKILGKSVYGTETISQATFVESIMAFISRDPLKDRDDLKQKKEITVGKGDEQKLIFRKLFKEGKDVEIAKNFDHYFQAARNKWPNAWNNKEESQILNRTTGFIALMKFFKTAYLSISGGRIDVVVDVSDFNRIFSPIEIDQNQFTRDNYKPGGSGIAKLYGDFMAGRFREPPSAAEQTVIAPKL
jgi:DGQHR domain-containing protein